MIECPYCKKPFFTKEKHQKYCSITCCNKHRSKERSPCFKGGSISSGGYRMISAPNAQGRCRAIQEHRYVMEQHIGRALQTFEHIHHINGDKLDNRIENLKIITCLEHADLHHRLQYPFFKSATHKQCKQCLQIKPRSAFHRANTNRLGDKNISTCRTCHNKTDRRRSSRT